MAFRRIGRRRFVAGTAAASAALVSAPFVRGAYAAGTLSIGLWDHWVPNANAATETLIKEWAEKEKVEVQIDFITTQGNKLLLTVAAEAQAKSGHDILAQVSFWPARYAELANPNCDIARLLLLPERYDAWIAEQALVDAGQGLAAEIPERLTLEEFEPMLAERIDAWNEQLREESRQEGQREGEARALLRFLERRFGHIDRATRDRIAAADADLLLEWIDRFTTAERLADIFSG